MATRGRKPKPTAMKELEGNPGKHPLNTSEPKPTKKAPACPKWLEPEAKKEWRRLAKQMEAIGILTEVDMAAFAGYCQAYARWKEAEEFITQHGTIVKTPSGYWQQVPQVSIAQTYLKIMNRFAEQFGLTPSSRSRIIASDGEPANAADEMESLLGGWRIMAETRPKNYPKLKDYKPSRFMLPTCHYDAAKADRAVTFIENLRHTKGKWAGKRFWLLPWQEQIIRDVFGIVDERGNRQFRRRMSKSARRTASPSLPLR